MKIKKSIWVKKTGLFVGTAFLAGTLLALSINIEEDLSIPHTAASSDSLNPCNIALTPHPGESGVDREIVRYQLLSQGKHTPEAYLERLGWAYIYKARISFDPGYYKLAQQSALCLKKKQPNNFQAQLLLGHLLHNLHQFKESEELARDLVDKRGSWLDYCLLGDILMEQGKFIDAVEAYQQMLNRRPGPQAYMRAAHMRWLKGDLAGAIDVMKMVVSSVGGMDKETAAWAYVKLAVYERQNNNTAAAKALIARALDFQPDYPPALLLRGEMLINREAYPEAVEVLSNAVRKNPLPLYLWTYREALQKAGYRLQAEEINQELLEKGALLDRRTFTLFLASTDQQSPLSLSLARKEFESRQDVFTMDALAWALRANGKLDEAYRYSLQALSEGTMDARLSYHAAVIAIESGMPDEAWRHYKNAKALKHLLFPSEWRELEAKFAAFNSRIHDLALNQ